MVISTTLKEKDMADRSSGLYNGDQTKLFSHTKRVGGYLLGKTIGEGSFAKVKLGLHIVTGEKVRDHYYLNIIWIEEGGRWCSGNLGMFTGQILHLCQNH